VRLAAGVAVGQRNLAVDHARDLARGEPAEDGGNWLHVAGSDDALDLLLLGAELGWLFALEAALQLRLGLLVGLRLVLAVLQLALVVAGCACEQVGSHLAEDDSFVAGIGAHFGGLGDCSCCIGQSEGQLAVSQERTLLQHSHQQVLDLDLVLQHFLQLAFAVCTVLAALRDERRGVATVELHRALCDEEDSLWSFLLLCEFLTDGEGGWLCVIDDELQLVGL
jgi:hypothetical protein